MVVSRRNPSILPPQHGRLGFKESIRLEESARNQAHGSDGPSDQRVGRAVQIALRRRSAREDGGLESRAGGNQGAAGAVAEARRDSARSFRGGEKRSPAADSKPARIHGLR